MGWSVSRWQGVPRLEHGFGGRSDPPPARALATLRQVHGTTVLAANDLAAERPDGDAIVTTTGAPLAGVWTADCVPVLLLDREVDVAAAAHAGWRGSAAGIVELVIERLEREWGASPARLEAALGPAIGGCCYEVGEEVRDAFRQRVGSAGLAGFDEREGRFWLDLRTFLAARLRASGVSTVDVVGPCTSCRSDLLHSYRKERGSGRQLSYVGFSA